MSSIICLVFLSQISHESDESRLTSRLKGLQLEENEFINRRKYSSLTISDPFSVFSFRGLGGFKLKWQKEEECEGWFKEQGQTVITYKGNKNREGSKIQMRINENTKERVMQRD